MAIVLYRGPAGKSSRSKQSIGDREHIRKPSRVRTLDRFLLLITAPMTMVVSLLLISACSGGLSEEEVQSRIDAGVATAVAMATSSPVLQAQRFELVDENNNVRAFLSTLSGGRPSLTLMDQSGEFRAWLYLNEEGSPRLALIDNPLLVLVDKAGEFRSVLRLEADGTPSFTLADEAGTSRSLIRLEKDGSPVLLFQNSEGEVIWSAPVTTTRSGP